MRTLWSRVLTALAACVLLAGCSDPYIPWASISGRTIETEGSGEEVLFTIEVDQAMIDRGKPVKLNTSGTVQSGELKVELRDPQGQAIWNPRFNGEFNANASYTLDQIGTYSLAAAWDGPVSATYNLSWNSITLTPAILLPGVGMILVAVGFAVYSLRRGSGWKYMALGALAWSVTVAIKFMLAIPLNPVVYRALYTEGSLWSPGALLFYAYVGLMTGVTEVLLTWLWIRYTRIGRAAWPQVLGFAVGFGAFEALLLGLLSLSGSLTALLSPDQVATTIGSFAQANNPIYGLAPVVERFATILVHVVCNVLLFYGALKGQSRWFWYAFVYKSALDAVAGFAQMWGVETVSKLWTIEAYVLVLGLIAWVWTARLKQRYLAEALAPLAAEPVGEPG